MTGGPLAARLGAETQRAWCYGVPKLLDFGAGGNVELIDDAARDLEDVSEEIMTPGHWPSWTHSHIPDGLALCVGCWRLITVRQLGGERCPRTKRAAR